MKPRPWRASPGYLWLALACVAGALGWALLAGPPGTPQRSVAGVAPHALASAPVEAAATVPAPALPASMAAAPRASAAAAPQIPRMREPNSDPTPDLADYVNAGERPTMAEVIERLHLAGVRSGLGAFSPPGTRPPLIGVAAPEDLALPPGYVRHYQATDDGQRIEPILMYAPDQRFVDAAGQPLAIPADRVVPPELAPPGWPTRRITIPAPLEPGR